MEASPADFIVGTTWTYSMATVEAPLAISIVEANRTTSSTLTCCKFIYLFGTKLYVHHSYLSFGIDYYSSNSQGKGSEVESS